MAGRPPNELETYPNRLRAVREAKGLTLAELAKLTGFSHQNLQRYETGERELKVWQLEKIAAKMKVRPHQLLNTVDPVDDEQEQAILSVFERLPPGERDRIIRMATALLPEGAAPQVRRTAS